MKKCCANCAFCARYINNSANSLTTEEHTQAIAGNFDFVGKKQRIQKAWQSSYKKIYSDLSAGKYNKQFGGMNVLEILEHANNPDDFTITHFPDSITECFRLPPYPDAPYQDFLICMQDLWNFKDKKNDFSSLNQKNKCLFFYPYDKKGNKSFDGCEKERVALQNINQFRITNILVIFGIIVSIFIYFLQRNDSSKIIAPTSEKSIIKIENTSNIAPKQKRTDR